MPKTKKSSFSFFQKTLLMQMSQSQQTKHLHNNKHPYNFQMRRGDVYRANTTLVSHTPNLPVSSHTSHANSGLRLSLEFQSLCRATSACLCVSLSFSFTPSLPPRLSATQTTQYPATGSARIHALFLMADGKSTISSNSSGGSSPNQKRPQYTHTHTHTHIKPPSHPS